MYYLLGSAVVLSGFFVVHALLAMSASASARISHRRVANLRPSSRAATWFALNLVPAAGAIVAATLLATAFVLYEPAHADESVGFLMGSFALLGSFALVRALVKLFAVRRVTRNLIGNWQASAVATTIPGWTGSALRLEHAFPLIAVVGIWRPRLFVSAKVLDQLEENELAAAIAHERGHLIARDNLKRVLVNFCAELAWWVPGAGSLRQRWADATEHAADEFAAGDAVAQPLSLASALVKLARMAPPGSFAAMPTGAFLVETAGDILTQRVTWLIGSDRSNGSSYFQGRGKYLTSATGMLCSALFALALIQFDLLLHLHELIEVFVKASFFKS